MPAPLQFQECSPDVFADFQIFLEIQAIARIDQCVFIPLEIYIVFLSAGDPRGDEFRIREKDSDRIPLEIFPAADLYFPADQPAYSFNVRHKLSIMT